MEEKEDTTTVLDSEKQLRYLAHYVCVASLNNQLTCSHQLSQIGNYFFSFNNKIINTQSNSFG